MSPVPIHHSSEHAAGPGADPEPDHREGQLTDRGGAQVSDSLTHTHTHSAEDKHRDRDLVNISFQAVLFGRSDCVLSWGAGDWPLLRCRGNREVQETSICGAAGFQSRREVLFCRAEVLRVHVMTCPAFKNN